MAIGTDPWELRHQSGHYAFLNDLAEAPRYGVIAAYLGHGARGGRVLDAGCGEAILVRHLPADCIREYVGVDRSQTALDRAPRARVGDLRIQLVCADLDSYTPPAGESFDALVFNEVLYNLASPLDAVARCARHLAPGGIAVISMYAYNRSGEEPIAARVQGLWNAVRQSGQWLVLDETIVQSATRGLRWHVQMLQLRSRHQE
jgi:SAM-dependent methyltransferase